MDGKILVCITGVSLLVDTCKVVSYLLRTVRLQSALLSLLGSHSSSI